MMIRRILLILIAFNIIILAGCDNKKVTVKESKSIQKITYTCPMHPQVISDKPGNCPICGMDLVVFDKTNVSEFLTLSAPQRALANIQTDTIKTGSFSSFKQLNGRLIVNPQGNQFISSRIAGRIEKLYVRETGVPIRKGQVLYSIYSEQLAALQQEYLVGLAQARQFPSDEKFRQITSSARQKLLLYGMSEGQVNQLRNTGRVSRYISFSSPSGGVVSQLQVTEGQYVGEGTPIMSLEGYQSLWVEADVYPAEAGMIGKGKLVKVTVTGFEDAPQNMKIDFIAPSFQTGNQLLSVRGTIQNNNNQYKAGMQAIVEVPVTESSGVITVPADAVIHEQKATHVWVEESMGKFKPKMVETGVQNFDRVEIKSGLEEGDVVVTSGAYLLYSEFVLKKGKNPMAAHNH